MGSVRTDDALPSGRLRSRLAATRGRPNASPAAPATAPAAIPACLTLLMRLRPPALHPDCSAPFPSFPRLRSAPCCSRDHPAWNAGADVADGLVRDGVQARGPLRRGHVLGALTTDEHDLVSDFDRV